MLFLPDDLSRILSVVTFLQLLNLHEAKINLDASRVNGITVELYFICNICSMVSGTIPCSLLGHRGLLLVAILGAVNLGSC